MLLYGFCCTRINASKAICTSDGGPVFKHEPTSKLYGLLELELLIGHMLTTMAWLGRNVMC